MGDRTVVRFTMRDRQPDINEVQAMIYLHWGGAPTYMKTVFESFFEDVAHQCGKDTRFNDPQYLAAKFVVWAAADNLDDPQRPLDFSGVGVVQLSVRTALESGWDSYAILCIPNARHLRPLVSVDECLTSDGRTVAFHQLTDIDEYLAAQRDNAKEETDA